MKKLLVVIALVSGGLAAIVLLRTALHTPRPLEAVAPVDLPLDAERIGRHLSEAIPFRTISNQHPSFFEPEQFERFIAWLSTTYPGVHGALELERIANYTLLYRWPGSDPSLQPILLTAHYDVVPVIPGSEGNWTQPPWSGAIVDGVIWGRGALDDKSGVIAQIEAVEALLERGWQPERTVYLSFGHDEEVGGRGAAAVTARLRAEGVRLEWSLDEGSFLFDGMLPGVEPLTATINVAEKGSVTVEIVATGAGGHSSMPPQQTAVDVLAEAIGKLDANPVPGGLSGLSLQLFDEASREMGFMQRLPFANRWLFGGVIEDQLAQLGFGNAMLRTTTAPTMLRASVKSNVLPIEAVATVNFRIHPRDSVDDVIEHVRRTVETDAVSVRVPAGSGAEASPVSDWNSRGFDVIRTAVREIYGDVVVAPGLMIAASDSRHYGKVADDAFRFNPMIVTPDDLTGFHGTNEKIAVDSLVQGVRTYMRILEHGAGG